MNTQIPTLADLGWGNFYLSQLSTDELETCQPHRVTEVHRTAIDVLGEQGPLRLPKAGALADQGIAVGDWLLCEIGSTAPLRLLERRSVLKRRGAGDDPTSQLIAANIDTLFIVSSCNADFNLPRLERYQALALQYGVEPVLILTKADLSDGAADYAKRARDMLRNITVELVDATGPDVAAQLMPWCGKGQTVALLGSSGVGKSTLTNALTDAGLITQGIREDDAKGKHTTTSRSMHAIRGGGWLIDTPGMRALRLTDVQAGVDQVFQDVADLAGQCRFNDCGHDTEPGCAIRGAIAAGDLDEARLHRWIKLGREDDRNSETIAQSHQRLRARQRGYQTGRKRGRDKRD